MNLPLQRPIHVGPGAAAGVTEAMIHEVVHAFYTEVRTDPAIGPIFNRMIGEGGTITWPRCSPSGHRCC